VEAEDQEDYEKGTVEMKIEIPLSKANRLINHGPTVLITSQSGGKPNVMTAAWQTPVSKDPPLVVVSIAPGRYTHQLIEESHEFVVNIPTHGLLKEVQGCGMTSGREVDKFEKFGLTPLPASKLNPPFIKECIAHLECILYDSIKVGDHTLFVGEILSASVEEDLFDEFLKVKDPRAKTLHHLGSNIYTCPDKRIEADS
jgi:flavin reductase (DIM6/NTAB) family NADH-FMN oxidoreductase RutF